MAKKAAVCNPPAVIDELFNANRRLCTFVLNRLMLGSKATPLLLACGGREACIQEAEIALWNAARYFDKDRGIKFATYACCSIYRRFADVLRNHRPLPLTRDDVDKVDDTDMRQRKQSETAEFVARILSRIGASDRSLLTRYYLEGKTLLTMGAEDGVTREMIRQRLLTVRRRVKRCLATVSNPFFER